MYYFFFLICALIISSIYIKAYLHTYYWRKRGIKGPVSIPFRGNLLDWYKKHPIVFSIRDWTKKYGSVYGIQEGWKNLLVVSDVDMLNELFAKKFEYFHGRKLAALLGDVDRLPRIHVFIARGKRWKRLRSILNPVFSVNNLKKLLPIMDDSAQVMLKILDKAYEKDQPFNIHNHFYEYAMDIIARIAMGQEGSQQFNNDYVYLIKSIFSKMDGNPFYYYAEIFPTFAPLILGIVRKSGIFRKDPYDMIYKIITQQVEARKQLRKTTRKKSYYDDAERPTTDFIELLLDAESNDLVGRKISKDGIFIPSQKIIHKKLTTTEIVSQCFVVLLAGFDTTSNALALTAHYLAGNMDVQKRLQEEIDEICPNGQPSYEQLNSLRYADCVFKETLRVCPIAAQGCARLCSKTTTLGGITIEAGSYVIADVLKVHMDEKIWGPDAAEFRPERWLEEFHEKNPINFMGFGGGPRLCIGMRLAYLEEKLALVYILRKYNIVFDKIREPLKLGGTVVLTPVSVNVRLEKREI